VDPVLAGDPPAGEVGGDEELAAVVADGALGVERTAGDPGPTASSSARN
jgi:hypothetical protein